MCARLTAGRAGAALLLFSLFASVVSHGAETLAAHEAAAAVLSATPLLQLRDTAVTARRPTVHIYGGGRGEEEVEESEHMHDQHHQLKGASRVRALVEHNPYDVEVTKVFMVLSSHFDAGCKVSKRSPSSSLSLSLGALSPQQLNHARLSTTQPRLSLVFSLPAVSI